MKLFSRKKPPAQPAAPARELPTEQTLQQAADVRALLDRDAVRDLVGRFACGIDFRDWDAFADLFTTTVSVHLDPRTSGSPPVPVPVALWKKFAAASFEAYDSTHHAVTVDYVLVDGDAAEAVSHFTASHYLANPDGSPTFVQKGTYHHRFERTAAGWRISGWDQDVRWGTGNRAVLDAAMDAMPGELLAQVTG